MKTTVLFMAYNLLIVGAVITGFTLTGSYWLGLILFFVRPGVGRKHA